MELINTNKKEQHRKISKTKCVIQTKIYYGNLLNNLGRGLSHRLKNLIKLGDNKIAFKIGAGK